MPSVYVLYTGGTIGCTYNSQHQLAPMPGSDFANLVGSMPGLANGQVANYPDLTYTIDWTPQPLDSSNMAPTDWINIAQQLAANYANHDGFVVLHGTDTMSFTASALSFLFQGLSKPIILTGSQVPLSFTLNDALLNLVGAIVMAGSTTPVIPEVCLYFNSLLLRGNRSAKVNANQFAAFASPNFPPLATVGTVITVNTDLILSPPSPQTSLSDPKNLQALQQQLQQFAVAVAQFSVISLILYPGINASTVKAMLQGTTPQVKGLIIQAFGEGNGPSTSDFLDVLKTASQSGVVLMDNTQVLTGTVESGAYATGLQAAGAISAYDMTPEAALTKLVYLWAQGLSQPQIQQQMVDDLRGELTPPAQSGTQSFAAL